MHSEKNVPNQGYDYTFIDSFAQNYDHTTDTLATMMVQSYSAEYPAGDVTLSNVRLDRTNLELLMAVDLFAVELIQQPSGQQELMHNSFPEYFTKTRLTSTSLPTKSI